MYLRSTVKMILISATCFIFAAFGSVCGQVLTPPYFNLAVAKPIEATATCGVGVTEPELFCKLTGANPETEDGTGDFEVIDGQLCDVCNPSDPTKAHSPEFAVDGSERWWQSPPLSRGLHYNDINLTIHLEQEFYVAYVLIKMGNSPRPEVFSLERSSDHGQTWQPWQFFADTQSNCELFFGHFGYTDRIDRDDAVLCKTEYSNVVPLEGGEVDISLVNNRPSANNFSHSPSLQNWTKATDIRLRLFRTKTLLGYLKNIAKEDPTVTRRYYYSIRNVIIGGTCVCYGHADYCDTLDPEDTKRLECNCQHNTCGQQCETCCPGFMQKPWRPAALDANNACEPCQCHGHSTECRYDPEVDLNRSSLDMNGRYEGGGVCIDCLHNTTGINCEQCKSGYFRPSNTPITSSRACKRCRCDLTFSTGNCMEGTGQCLCKHQYAGHNCSRCNVGHSGYPRCFPCQCHVNGTQGGVCEVGGGGGGGQCPCKANFDGKNCDQCAFDYYNFPECRSCDCDNIGSRSRGCDVKSGQCRCLAKYGGRKCNSCAPGYHNYPACNSCNCDHNRVTTEVCDKETGRCICKENLSGSSCDRCAAGYFNWPHCYRCICDLTYTTGNCMDGTGQCLCKPQYAGTNCDRCNDGYGSYPRCVPCHCHTNGTQGGVCEVGGGGGGQCPCKPNFDGINCDQCAFDYYNFPECRSCECDNIGSRGRGCDVNSGQCRCITNYGGRKCNSCAPGSYGYPTCDSCNCDDDGATAEVCDKENGRCICKENFSGSRCEHCALGYFDWPHCHQCDNCVHLLMDDLEILDHNITSLRHELDSVTVSIVVSKRLEKINRTVSELRPLVDNLICRATDQSQLNLINRELNEIQTLATDVDTKSGRSLRKSELVESDATDAKFQAEILYQDLLQVAIEEANEAVDFVKEIVKSLQNGIGGNRINELLRQAERMLSDIKSRDFSFSEGAAREELRKARETLREAKKLMNRITAKSNRTVEMSLFIHDLMSRLQDLQNRSCNSLNQSLSAVEINNRTRQLLQLVTDANHKIYQTERDIRSCIERVRELLNNATKLLTDVRQKHTDLRREFNRLNVSTIGLHQSVLRMSRENTILQPLVQNASQHARQLKADAELLESVVVDTRATADAALRASKAYQTIVDAISSAYNDSISALASVVTYSGLLNNVTRLRRRSEIVTRAAENITEAAAGLRMRSTNVNKTLEETKKILDEYDTFVRGLHSLPSEGYEAEARKVTKKAMDAQTKADIADQKIKTIVNGLPEDQRKLTGIEKSIRDTKVNTRTAQNKVDQTIRLLPDVTNILSRLSSQVSRIRQLGCDLKSNFTELRNRVKVARDEANLIRVGMSFSEESSLQVRNPRSLTAAGFFSRVSLYFKTNANNGLLFYAGPIQSQETWNYMSLQLIGGKAVFKFDLGSGAAIVTIDKFVSDGVWHEAIMSRSGRNGTLTIRTPNEESLKAEGRTNGKSIILNVDNTTRMFVGGVTEAEKNNLKDILSFNNFTGCIEDVKFDAAAVGLWNIVSAGKVDGCSSRDTLEEPHITGYMFGGDGYVILAKDRFKPVDESIVKFTFRTFASEGLLFLIGMPHKDFLSLELKDGKVIYKYDLGSGRATLASTQRYNDGKWYTVIANRNRGDGNLRINSSLVDSTRSPGSSKQLNIDNNYLYFGGFNGTHTYSNASVTQRGFQGCIKDIQLGSTIRNIFEHIEAKDILPGCPETTVRVLSFASDVRNAYISVNPVRADATSEMAMKFKTVKSDGILFYVTDDMKTQSSAFSLFLNDGKVVAMSNVSGRAIELKSSATYMYNDDHWHYLTVRKGGKNMSLHIDDSDTTTIEANEGHWAITNSTFFFGSLPSTRTILLLQNVTSSTQFVGCIGDVTIGQEFINFDNVPPNNKNGVVLGSCQIPPDRTPCTTVSTIRPTTISKF